MQTNFNRTIPQLKTKKRIELLADANVENQLAQRQVRKPTATDFYHAHALNSTGTTDFKPNDASIRGMSNHSSIKFGDSRLTYTKSFQQEAYRNDNSNAQVINVNVHQKSKRQNYMDYKEALEMVDDERIMSFQNILREKVMQKREQGGSQLRKAFKIFDRQMNGYVDLAEFQNCLRRMNLETTPVETLALFGTINRSCSGRIEYYEFVNNFMEVPFDANQKLGAMIDKLMGKFDGDSAEYHNDFTDEEIQAIYSKLDVNGDNQVTIMEFGELLETLGKDLSMEDIAEAFRLLDTDGSGFIEFEEFLSWWKREKDSLPNSPTNSRRDSQREEKK